MNVPSATATQTQNQTAATAAPQTVDYQSFLRLLVAEMKNQDPTSPMESTDYVAQLATFSQVEQSVQINTKLDQILQASALAQAGSLVGREITSADGSITGKVAEVRLYSDGVMAVLESGDKIPVGPGVVIR
ncbi:flagellar hook assembly protein FlgD [Nitratireductor sp. ZSWI3]|uniref:flagellar hook assembly protein FlgD n=1 Tax=Nitratireductor sp. ZSWI3 TaxID=2966359 RepID=UPI00214FF5C3|nr:flagellar hook assembly protein FlgD [Nitratireductor sp. ZSWI3]MCR4264809.1 flagellar hook assembly protein FlgD [Nitratireductor sp. ZSWI3]